jgi:di/tricarboxylate transporter
MLLFRRWLLPVRDGEQGGARDGDLMRAYQLQESLFSVRVPDGSRLAGLSLRETRFGTALGVQVVSILRGGRRRVPPAADAVLAAGDVLLVQGKISDVEGLFRVQGVRIEEARPGELTRSEQSVDGMTVRILPGSTFAGRTLRELRFRERFGAIVVTVRRDGAVLRGELASEPLEERDELVLLGPQHQLERLAMRGGLDVTGFGGSVFEGLEGEFFVLDVPEGSGLSGTTLAQSRLRELVGLTVLGVLRGGRTLLALEPGESIAAGDRLLVSGEKERIHGLLAPGDVELGQEVADEGIGSADVAVVEATIAPRSRAAGATLERLSFRNRYGLRVLAVWREGHPIHTGLAKLKLRVGDALLLQGPWNKIQLLASDPDFVVLAASAHGPRRVAKAPFALGGLLILIAFVVTGFQPIHVAAFVAATFVVLTGAITMEEAYRGVEWRAVFLVAAILPVGIAMERTGAALLLADAVTSSAGAVGPYGVLAGLFVLSSLLSQCLDGAPAVVLLTPVALTTAEQLGLSPYPIMMGISLAASAAFMTPFSHKANLLVMGAGGYRVSDYLRAGTPLTVVVLLLLVFLVPVFFPVR